MHMVCLVLVPKEKATDFESTEAAVAKLMEPFNKNREFPERETDCYCVKDGKADPACGFYRGKPQDWWHGAKAGDRFGDESGCGGTGRVLTTNNPKARWDWYMIGGRWSGWLVGETHDVNAPAVFQDQAGGDKDVVPVPDVPRDKIPYAVLCSNGEWLQRKHWINHTFVKTEPEEWEEELRLVFEAHKDSVAVVVDCHT